MLQTIKHCVMYNLQTFYNNTRDKLPNIKLLHYTTIIL